LTVVGFVCADIAGKLMNSHRLAIQPIFDLMQAHGYGCHWANWAEPWGQIPGINKDQVACWVTSEPGMTSNDFIKRTFFHPHGLHPTEGAYVTARAPYGDYTPWLGYLGTGEYWLTNIDEASRASGSFPITGWAKLDTYFKPGIKEETIRKLNLGLPHAKTVLYAPCGNWHWAASFEKSVMHIIHLFEGLPYNLLIKVGEYAESFTQYVAMRNRLNNGPPNMRLISYQEDVTPLYSLADVVVTDGSSVAWEVIGLDKPVIQLTNMLDPLSALCPGFMIKGDVRASSYNIAHCKQIRLMAEKNPEGKGTLLTDDPECHVCAGTIKSTLEGLGNILAKTIEKPDEFASERRMWAASVNALADGHSAERCVAAIKRLAKI